MKSKYSVEIRCDDVLQTSLFSGPQKRYFGIKPPFEWFKEADQLFEQYNYPCTLAVLAEGIDKCSDWVDYIKKNQNRYKIELHGSAHLKYGRFETGKELFNNLKEAIDKIETTFETEITTWYVPWGRKGWNKHSEDVCRSLGITLGIPQQKINPKRWLIGYNKEEKPPFFHINFHYWYLLEIGHIKQVLKLLYG